LLQLLTTTAYSLEAILAMLIWFLLVLIFPCLLCLACCCCCYGGGHDTRTPGGSVKAWPLKSQERTYLAVHSHHLESLVSTTSASMSTRKARDPGLADAEPQHEPFLTHYPGAAVPPLSPSHEGSGQEKEKFRHPFSGYFCCSSTKPGRLGHLPLMGLPSAASSPGP